MKQLKNRSLFIICLLFTVLSAPAAGFGKNIISVETGDYHSASWQFTEELSELWQKIHPETESGFVPVYTKQIEDRFSQLLSGNCRFVIAPLDGYANQIMLSRPVKLVTLLWTVYLLPIDIGKTKAEISLNNYRYWYVPRNSVIVPRLMQILGKKYFAAHFRKQFKLENENQGIIDETTTQSPTVEKGLIEKEFAEDQTGQKEESAPLSMKQILNSDQITYQKSAEIAGLGDFNSDVLEVNTRMIPEILETYQQGILFYEMMGSINELNGAVANPVESVQFNKNIRDFLISVHPWIHPFYNNRAGINTLEFNMALYVNEKEDPEFVENIIKLLSERQKSYFPPSFIFSNLAIQKTSELSPLFMHAGSLKFFGLD